MKKYLVTFKPVEPYFFGNEKNFAFRGQEKQMQLSNSYFIRSEKMPAQTTLLGVLRYLLLPVKRQDYGYTKEEQKKNDEMVGAESFRVSCERTQQFGKIKSLSPVFLYHKGSVLIYTPFDHKAIQKEKYTPVAEYKKGVMTADGEVYYTREYDAKTGITDSYMNLDDGSIVCSDQIFEPVVRTGINRSREEDGYFKKEYYKLKKEYAFGVYLEYDGQVNHKKEIAYLGQGKSVFCVEFEEVDDNAEDQVKDKIKQYLNDNVVYCWGDAFLESSIYEKCYFSITKLKTYRAYTTQGKRVTKHSKLYRLVSAGSIFIPRDKNEFLKSVKIKNGQQIGYNQLIYSEGDLL